MIREEGFYWLQDMSSLEWTIGQFFSINGEEYWDTLISSSPFLEEERKEIYAVGDKIPEPCS